MTPDTELTKKRPYMTQKDLEILLRQAKSYYESGLVISPVLLRRNKETGKKVPTFLYRFSDLSNYNWTFFKKLCKVYFNKYGYFNGLCCHVDRTKNLIIIDTDSEKASETISRMTGPKVLRSRTPSGGVHYWFETEKPVPFHQNRIIRYDIPRLVFLPGSRVEGPTEGVYKWIDKNLIIPPLPVGLQAYLNKMATGIKELDRPVVQGSNASVIDLERTAAQPGQRHSLLCKISGKLKAKPHEFSRSENLKYLLRHNERKDFRKPVQEIIQLVNWIYDN